SGRSGWSGTANLGVIHTSVSGGTANSDATTPTTGTDSPLKERVRPTTPGSEANILRHSRSERTASRVPTGRAGSNVRPASTRAGKTRKKWVEATAPGSRTGFPTGPALNAWERQPATSAKACTAWGRSARSPPERTGEVRSSVKLPESTV